MKLDVPSSVLDKIFLLSDVKVLYNIPSTECFFPPEGIDMFSYISTKTYVVHMH